MLPKILVLQNLSNLSQPCQSMIISFSSLSVPLSLLSAPSQSPLFHRLKKNSGATSFLEHQPRYQYNKQLLRSEIQPHHCCLRKKCEYFSAPFSSYCIHNKRSRIKMNEQSSKTASISSQTASKAEDDSLHSASAQSSQQEAAKILRQQKQALRKKIRSCIRSSYPPINSDDNDCDGDTTENKLIIQSNKVFSRLFSLPQYHSATSIGFFLSMPSGEIQTREAIRKIVEDGKVLYVPRVGLDFEESDMDLVRAVTKSDEFDGDEKFGMFYDDWPKNKWGIPEPPISSDTSSSFVAQPGDIDLLLVPGLAFDSNGHRMGQGKGYYDRFIAKMRNGNDAGEEKKPFLVGVCLEEQFIEVETYNKDDRSGVKNVVGGIPVSDLDYIMDMVLSPSKTITVSRSS